MKELGIKLAVFGVVVGVLAAGGAARADFLIGNAELMDEAINHPSSTGINSGCSLSHDGLRLYFDMRRDGGHGDFDIWVSERESPDAPWGEAVNLGPNINGPDVQDTPTISPDELELYFWTHEGGYWRSMQSTRASKDEPWGPATEYTGINPGDFSSDGLTMYFGGRHWLTGYGEGDVWMVTRATTDDEWGEPVNLGPNVNNERRQGDPSISHDDLALFFNEDDSLLMRMSVRRTRDGDWGPAVDISATLCPDHQKRYGPDISPDGTVLYFHHHDWGAFTERRFWQASISPVVDFNADGKVDVADLVILIENWGTDDSTCDIGPMPWGDGIVDVQDLLVLAEYIEPAVRIQLPTAHWALDETEGIIAHDSCGSHDGTVTGDAVWQPGAGMVDGALEFDGVDDFVGAELILDPEDGPFSLFAWIKGGAPGQVVVSQADARVGRYDRPGCSWLAIDPALGTLTTDLVSPQFIPPATEVAITDGQWHRVGLVWDASSETSVLYVDDVEVATDVQPTLPKTYGGLQIGAGRSREPTTFFTGLIDDVRIYNRAVKP